MKFTTLTPMVAGLALCASPAFADPPAEVEVVEESGDDWFAPPPAAEPSEGVKARAADLFEELEREEARHGKGGAKKKVTARVSQDGDVAEVEVIVEDEDSMLPPATPKAPAPPATPDGATTPTPPPTPGASSPPPPPGVSTTPKRSWWDRPSHPQAGDLILWVGGGSFDSGGFGGIGGEGMASDTFGIRLSGMYGRFGHQQPGTGFSDNFDFFEGGQWAIQRDVNPETATGGFVHLTELSMSAHLIPKSMFDLYTTLGLAHFGYEVDFRDGTERGGAAYTRVGAGANLHFKRFFAGMDFGWYPVELFRYTITERRRDDYEADFQPVNNRFEAERFTLTAQVGMRF